MKIRLIVDKIILQYVTSQGERQIQQRLQIKPIIGSNNEEFIENLSQEVSTKVTDESYNDIVIVTLSIAKNLQQNNCKMK